MVKLNPNSNLKVSARLRRIADRAAAKQFKMKQKAKVYEAKTKAKQAKRQAVNANKALNKSTASNNLSSNNPIARRLAEHREIAAKKHEVKMRKLESEAKLAELNPKLEAAKAETENQMKVERSRYRTKTASAAALASGMATLGRGLSDENNQDDAANRKSDLMKIQTIFGNQGGEDDSSDGTGLKQGVE